ncbi:MAG: Arc family DNA-binding protein [Casimicrobiaceae bacterium]|nr:Arc family DNA-binding protein [Casimicrobiaceae bacterium]MCX8099563.1 Arc family DNA-binding protein [Casimicrobiaceae bacterium]MDW8313011.1 Arc family DNA-binding protein [Burkholderiales bacterium]
MPNLSIKAVPESWAEALRRRAARNHRSLQGELMAIIEQAVQAETMPPRAPLASAGGAAPIFGAEPSGRATVRQGWRTVEEVVAELRAKFPEPIRDQAASVALIREDRDRR